MKLKRLSLAFALGLLVGITGYAQAPQPNQDRDTPTFRVQIWGYVTADFNKRTSDYADLRHELEKGLPPLVVTDDPAEIRRAVRALRNAIRVARAGAKQGDIFTPTTSDEFRRTLLIEMNANSWNTIMDADGNPGTLSKHINGSYPDGEPLSTVPPSILAALPTLPDDIVYRFLGRTLILLDTRAGVILDWISHAIKCVDCDGKTRDR